MKVLLINPMYLIYGGVKGMGGSAPPLGLAYLASYLREKKNDVEISIIDTEALGLTMEQVKKKISEIKPDIVGITSTTPCFHFAQKISEIVKEVNPQVKTVLGGAHPSALPEKTIKYDSIDFVVVGEGEITFYELVSTVESGGELSQIDGLLYKKEGQVIKNQSRALIQDLDLIPFPARDLLPNHLYGPPPSKRVSTYKPTSITSGRGCPFRCTFCCARVVWTRRYRGREPVKFVDEIQHCIEKYDMREFAFTDELFTADHKRALAICDEIIKRGLKIAWVCSSRAGLVSPDLLKKMKKAGCREISFGVESGNQKVLETIHKDIKLDWVRKSIKLVKKAGIKTHASYMIGNIGETEETVRDTIDLAKKLNTDIAAFFVASPYPGTELYNQAVEKGYMRKDYKWFDFSPLSNSLPVLNLPTLSSERIVELHRQALKEYYWRPAYIIKKLLGLRKLVDFLNIYHGLRLYFAIKVLKG